MRTRVLKAADVKPGMVWVERAEWLPKGVRFHSIKDVKPGTLYYNTAYVDLVLATTTVGVPRDRQIEVCDNEVATQMVVSVSKVEEVCEASDLMLPVGDWPHLLTFVVDEGPVRTFARDRAVYTEGGEFAGYEYVSNDGDTLTILND